VVDIQSLTRLELKRPSRSETRILRWHGYRIPHLAPKLQRVKVD
jgi:hypothetical protein